MSNQGYYAQPTIHDDRIVFVSDDDLWTVPVEGGLARRLTRSNGSVARPCLSPCGGWIAYSGVEEGYPEVHVMRADGGPGRRLTRLASQTLVLGWTPDGERVVFASATRRPNFRLLFVYAVPLAGGVPERLPVGPAVAVAFGSEGQVVVARGAGRDAALWKRYRGGRIGELWIDRDGQGRFERLIDTGGNLERPCWIEGRIYFHSDHQGVGNLYSCLPDGQDLRRHTDHRDFYLRAPSTDGHSLVYAAGGDLYRFDPRQDRSERVEIEFPTSRAKRVRRFVPADRYLEDYHLHPEGRYLTLIARGKPLAMAHWDGAVRQLGVPGGRVRYRLARWLRDGKHILCVSGEGRQERLEIFEHESGESRRLEDLDIGRATRIKISPTGNEAVLTNHRGELIHVDLDAGTMKVLDCSRHGRIDGFDLSPDGRWVAYGRPRSQRITALTLCEIATGELHLVVEPILADLSPSFDPEGKFLFFLSMSGFDPVPDVLDFKYGFPLGITLKLVTLQADQTSPFLLEPCPPNTNGESDRKEPEKKSEGDARPLRIDLEGITGRVVAFPVEAGIYTSIHGLPGCKVLYTSRPVRGILGGTWPRIEPESNQVMHCYDLEKGKQEVLAERIAGYEVSADGKTLVYRAGRRLRVIPAGKKPDASAGDSPGRESGWVDLGRPRISVEPLEEWRQMFAEGWALLRDHYWTEDMAGVDWEAMYRRYAPLVDRCSTRRELSDLFWELGGELGTSHAYEIGGDYPPVPRYPQGFLGAELELAEGEWRLVRIIPGDPGEEGRDSPLNGPGINLVPGDVLLAVNGVAVSPERSPDELLVNQGGALVELTFRTNQGVRSVTVKALRNEMPLRHREWVRRNAEQVHRATDGRIGYVHLSDMGAQGFSEFHRAFLVEAERDGLIVDVRGNAGGHVSPLILERLRRPRTGYSLNRWSEPNARPPDTVVGPIVGLTDQFSGSDGDVFSHNFKQLGIGPLIGKRTWGGIVGLNPTHPLVDGTVTTQPEFYNWFPDVKFGLENWGAEPDVEVEITPQDYVAGRDPQLEKAIQVAREMLDASPVEPPEFGPPPDRSIPDLPPR